MTELHMKRAARAAGAQPRAVAIYAPGTVFEPAYASLLLSAAFGTFMWALFLTRAVWLIS